VTRLVPIHNPHPGGTYIWFTVPELEAEADQPEAAPEPEAEP
jgi:hypothetical protein